MEIRVKSRGADENSAERCPYCLDLVESLEAAVCESCETVHHALCFQVHGKCTVLGCGGRARELQLTLDESSLMQIRERLTSAPETAVLGEIERLARSGVSEPAISEALRPFSSPRVELALLALRARSGRSGAAQALLEALRTSQGSFRNDVLKSLAGLPQLPRGIVKASLEVLREGGSRARCEALFKRFGEAEIAELLELLIQSEVEPNQGFEALRWTFSSCRGPQRDARIEILRRLTGRHRDPLASALFSAALLTDALAQLRPRLETTEDRFAHHLETALWLGLPLALLSFATALVIPDSLGFLWFSASFVAACFALALLGLKALESASQVRRLRIREMDRKKRTILEWRLRQVLEGREFDVSQDRKAPVDEKSPSVAATSSVEPRALNGPTKAMGPSPQRGDADFS